MPDLEFRATVDKATETITHVSDTGGTDATYKVTFAAQLTRRDFLRLCRAKLRNDDLLLRIDVGDFQMSLDDMWDKGSCIGAGMMARPVYRHRWTDEEDDVVRASYEGTRASRLAIALQLGVTEHAVAGRVTVLGLAKITDRQRWDPEQDERLRQLLELHPPAKVAKLMGRGVNSVVLRAKRIGASRRDRFGWYTKTEICEILGKDHKWVQRRIDDGSLKASWHHGRQPQKNGQASWHIEQKDLKAFLRRYPEQLNGRNVDLVAVVEIHRRYHLMSVSNLKDPEDRTAAGTKVKYLFCPDCGHYSGGGLCRVCERGLGRVHAAGVS